MNIKSPAKRDWTVLVYQGNGCFDKHGEHHLDTLEMQKLPASDRVTILTQGHRDYNEDILDRRVIRPFPGDYYLVDPVDTVEGRQNEPEQLADFIRWGMENYPSERTCLVISGFAGGNNGMIVDKKDGLMPLTEVRKGLEEGLGGKELDVLALDGHWMACIEAAAEFENTADLMVASQGRMRSWDYEERFSELLKKPDSDADALAGQLFEADAGESGTSILDLGGVSNALYWTETLLETAAAHGVDTNAFGNSAVYHFQDLQSVMENFTTEEKPEPVCEVATEAIYALEELVLAHHPLSHTPTNGLSVANFYDDPEDGRAFRDRTSWDKFLEKQRSN